MFDIEAIEKKDHKKSHLSIKTESLLRDTTSHYIRLIGDADRKARIILIVNSILITIAVTLLTKAVDKLPYVWICAFLLIGFNLLSLFFSVLSVRHEVQNHIAKELENNILHYTKCTELPLGEYTSQMLNTMHDNDKKLFALIKNLYFYGNLLCMKYRLMKISYRFFFWGIALSVVSYLFMLLLVRSGNI